MNRNPQDSLKKTPLSLYIPSLAGGGAEKITVNLANCFAAQGLKVDLVVSDLKGPLLKDISDKIRIIDLRSSRVIFSLIPLVIYLARNKPRAILSSLNYANVIVIISSLLANFLAKAKTRVYVAEHSTLSQTLLHPPNFRTKFLPLLMKHTYKLADGIITVSKGVAADLAKIIGIPPSKIFVIYNPVFNKNVIFKKMETPDHPWFKPGSPPVILGVGRLHPAKDFSCLIKAFKALREELDVKLVILGEGEERSKLELLINDLGLQDEIDLPGFVRNPYEYMDHSSVFVLSSQWEGLPTVLIEALACGLPIVSTDCPSGPREILEDGKYGLLVRVGDELSLTKALSDILTNKVGIEKIPAETLMTYEYETAANQYLKLLIGESI
ncbi:glycosyltransferase [Desulfosporosinus hippei]|uniref:Glycosyltransferase involved in cell wall bisynthesis n=1 Tax=Desulfosporosinus hippei DSM 8344 TaxID=1121419 RepID=A0A1G8H1C2_9FIRM|nr:glycosyltransferase [Desulfosporosinus hippei]SDI00482.1 Glycosyltransferase involved in cell wall bisynthesis [Desulfosporosinus hippei DSM 8344]